MSEIKLTLEQRALIKSHETDLDAIRQIVAFGIIDRINMVLPMYAKFAADMAGKYATLAAQYGEDVGEAAALIPEFVQLLYAVQAKAYEIDTATPGLFGLPALPEEESEFNPE